MKKFLCLLLTLPFLFSLAACAPTEGDTFDEPSTSAAPAESTEPGEVTEPEETESEATESAVSTPEEATEPTETSAPCETTSSKNTTAPETPPKPVTHDPRGAGEYELGDLWFENALTTRKPTIEELEPFLARAMVLLNIMTPIELSGTHQYDPEYIRNKDYFYRVMSSYFRYPSKTALYYAWEKDNPFYDNDTVWWWSPYIVEPIRLTYPDYAHLTVDDVTYEDDTITLTAYIYRQHFYFYAPASPSGDRDYADLLLQDCTLLYEDGRWKLDMESYKTSSFLREQTIEVEHRNLHISSSPYYENQKINTAEEKKTHDLDDPEKYDKEGRFGARRMRLKNKVTIKAITYAPNALSKADPNDTEIANFLASASYFMSFFRSSKNKYGGTLYGYPTVGDAVEYEDNSYVFLDPAYADTAKLETILQSYFYGTESAERSYLTDAPFASSEDAIAIPTARRGVDNLYLDFDTLYRTDDEMILRVYFYAEWYYTSGNYEVEAPVFLYTLKRSDDGLWRVSLTETYSMASAMGTSARSATLSQVRRNGSSEFFQKGA